MARLLALMALLAVAVGAGAKQPDARAQALKVPSRGPGVKRPGVAGVSAAMESHSQLRLTFDAAALAAAEARTHLAPAAAADDVTKLSSAADKLDAASPPAEELPLPKARLVSCPVNKRDCLRNLGAESTHAATQGAAAAGFERATVATTPHAVTVTLYRGAPLHPAAAPVTSDAICGAALGLGFTILAALAGTVYYLFL